MRFSQRYGLMPLKNTVQTDSIDDELRNALWSCLQIHFWDRVKARHGVFPGYYLSDRQNEEFCILCKKLWLHFFKKPLDTLQDDWAEVHETLRKYFFSSEWYEVYDFLEFVATEFPVESGAKLFTTHCNTFLEREVSAYRFVDQRITRIVGEEEIAAIEDALQVEIRPVRDHLNRSLELLSDRRSPDYRNSIKESISAVEAVVKKVTGLEKGTLGDLLKVLEKSHGLHPALKGAFSKLYGYTSNADGIRHALMGSDGCTFEQAKFMMVTCSAFVNYVVASSKT